MILFLEVTSACFAWGGGTEEQAIRALVADVEKAYNNGESLLGLLTTGGDLRPFDGPVLSHKELAKQPTPIFKVPPMKRTVEQIRFVKPDLALVDGRLQATGADGKTPAAILGRFTYVVAKQGATWRIEASRMARTQQ